MIDVGCPKFFACDECPIVAELDYRLANSEKYGYPFQFDHCACDKVEDEFFYCGYCEDAWADVPKRKKKGKRKTGRAYRRKMRVQKFNRQKNLALNCNAPEPLLPTSIDVTAPVEVLIRFFTVPIDLK